MNLVQQQRKQDGLSRAPPLPRPGPMVTSLDSLLHSPAATGGDVSPTLREA